MDYRILYGYPYGLPWLRLDAKKKQFRLLSLHLGEPNAEVSCSLLRDSLEGMPLQKYETISYVWGDTTTKKTIRLNGYEIGVGASAKRVLRRFRLPHRSRFLWIDAVCIIQNDLEERSQQVALMADIYSKAAHGLIWLGDDDGYAHAARDCINAVYEDARGQTDNFRLLKETVYDDTGRLRYSATGLAIDIDPAPLARLLECPWFQRLWVVQEASLADTSTCYWGDVKLWLTKVLTTWLTHKYAYLSFEVLTMMPRIDNASMMWELADKANSPFRGSWAKDIDLIFLLDMVRSFHAHDSRDHVFGIIGLYQRFTNDLVPDVPLPVELVPDYTKPWAEVYRDATRFAVEETRDLSLLYELYRRPAEIADDMPFTNMGTALGSAFR
ncbi:Uu.00g137730.m01.CDS01 [Anthostomella pinea]|uniref:Uu.00g137730.m01.CDS01 n=1 Tax=Anthostomella pinea TaxID=933095 RepID=A0AAI8YL39_9PEZI|nr:Uu.00g137730.m01.CDS01 [Anthostomella pinea]